MIKPEEKPETTTNSKIVEIAVETSELPKRNRVLKKKDPHLPKAPASSYFLFFKDKRPELKELHKECSGS